MKPRLIKINSVWHCCLPGEWRDPGFIRFCGLGYTPADAYRDRVTCNYAPQVASRFAPNSKLTTTASNGKNSMKSTT